MEKIKIEGRKYHGLVCSGKVFNNYTFTDCTFEVADFSQCTFVNCTFVNCTIKGIYNSITESALINCNFENCCLRGICASEFTSCSFSSCYITGLSGNYLLDCQFSDVTFGDDHNVVQGNTFERVRGNIKNMSIGVYENIFKDMDFSGFVDFYCIESFGLELPYVDLVQNSFINTTISTDAIMGLARKTEYFGTNFMGRRNISPKNGIVIILNMHNLSDEEKFGLIANAFLRLPNVDEDVLFCDPEKSAELRSQFHFFFDDNDDSPIIIGEDGRVLKPDAIPRIDMQIDFCKEITGIVDTMTKVDVEGEKYRINLTDDSIYEPSKHR